MIQPFAPDVRRAAPSCPRSAVARRVAALLALVCPGPLKPARPGAVGTGY